MPFHVKNFPECRLALFALGLILSSTATYYTNKVESLQLSRTMSVRSASLVKQLNEDHSPSWEPRDLVKSSLLRDFNSHVDLER